MTDQELLKERKVRISSGISKLINGAAIALFSAFFGAVGTIIVAMTGFFNKDREMDIQMVRIALEILSDPKNMADEHDGQRKFALNLLQNYSGVKVSEDDESNWRSSNFVKLFPNLQDACAESVSNIMNDLSRENFEQYWIAGCATHIKFDEFNKINNYLLSPDAAREDNVDQLNLNNEEMAEIEALKNKLLEYRKTMYIDSLKRTVELIKPRPTPQIEEFSPH